jgi:hypothetical protein
MIDHLIDRLIHLRAEKAELGTKLKALGEEEARLEGDIMNAMTTAGTFKAMDAHGNTVTLVKKTTPTVINWPEFYAFLEQSHRFDLLQKRISPVAFRDMWNAGEAVPGSTAVDTWDITVRRGRG